MKLEVRQSDADGVRTRIFDEVTRISLNERVLVIEIGGRREFGIPIRNVVHYDLVDEPDEVVG